jgi:CRP-like cAMP-binding protein
VFTKAVDEVEGEYGEITAEVWQFLRPTPAYLIGRHPLFREMSRVILRKVCESAQRRQFSAGDTLLRAGQPADTLYIVVAGMLEAVPAGPAGERRRLFPGDALGESCALRRQPAAITLVALMTTEVLEVKQAQLDFILQEYPMLRAQLTDRASRIESARIPL